MIIDQSHTRSLDGSKPTGLRPSPAPFYSLAPPPLPPRPCPSCAPAPRAYPPDASSVCTAQSLPEWSSGGFERHAIRSFGILQLFPIPTHLPVNSRSARISPGTFERSRRLILMYKKGKKLKINVSRQTKSNGKESRWSRVASFSPRAAFRNCGGSSRLSRKKRK